MTKVKKAKVAIGKRKYSLVSDGDYLANLGPVFEPHTVRLLQTAAQDSRVVLDIGANIGCTALLLSQSARQVQAFEPSPSTFSFLKRNISRARTKNIITHNFGLGAEAAKTTLSFNAENRSGGYVSDQTKASAGHVVEEIAIRTLDEVVNSDGIRDIDFIKIDVEGFEGQVLRGAAETLSTLKPLVALELNHWCLNAFRRTSIPDFFDFLRSQFPFLLAIEGSNYLDLHSEDDSYVVMYHHIVHMRFPDILAAFDSSQLDRFRNQYQYGFS